MTLKLYVKAMTFIQAMKDESGQDLIEYSLIGALIAVGAIVGMQGLSTAINGEFTSITGSL